MKFTKIILTFISFLIITNYSFALNACPGQSVNLDYSVAGVDFVGGESCNDVDVPSPFVPPPKPTSNTNGTWVIPVPSVAPGSYNFTLTCGGGGAVSSVDTLTVLSPADPACVIVTPPPLSWTDYCPLSNDPNGNQDHTWQYDNQLPVGYSGSRAQILNAASSPAN